MNPCENCTTTQLLNERLDIERKQRKEISLSQLRPPTINEPQKPTQPTPLKPKIKPLDAFAGAMITLIWITATYSIFSNYGITAYSIIGAASFWILYVVVFRLVAGGILD